MSTSRDAKTQMQQMSAVSSVEDVYRVIRSLDDGSLLLLLLHVCNMLTVVYKEIERRSYFAMIKRLPMKADTSQTTQTTGAEGGALPQNVQSHKINEGKT